MSTTSFAVFRLSKAAFSAFVWLAIRCQPALAQSVPNSVLQIEVQNVVRYNEDVSDITKFATSASATPPTLPRNFYEVILAGVYCGRRSRTRNSEFCEEVTGGGLYYPRWVICN